MRDALKNYLTLASGLTEVGRQRAMAAAKALVAQGEATAEQVGNLADDLIQTSKANREMVTQLVRTEVERTLNTVGLATADSVERLTKRLQALEGLLRDASSPPAGGTAEPAAQQLAAPAKKAAAKTAKTAKPATKAAATKPAKAAANGAARPAKAAAKPAKAAKPAATKPAKKARS